MATFTDLLKRVGGEYVPSEEPADAVPPGFDVPDDLSELDPGAPEAVLPQDKPSSRLTPEAVDAATSKPMTPTQQRKYIQDCVEMMLEFFSWSWRMRDEYCGSVAEKQIKPVAARMTAIIMDHDDWVAFFTKSGGFMKWLMLATSLKPIGEAIVAHHVFHTKGDDKEMQERRRERNAQYADL